MVADFGEDILSTSLVFDVSSLDARATLTFSPPPSGVASFEIGDLAIASVDSSRGEPLPFRVEGARLDVDLRRAHERPATIVVGYRVAPHAHSDGWNPTEGLTFLWPQFCGNLFPCKSDPSDGARFELDVRGVPDGATAIYPRAIVADAPSYMPAIVVGALRRIDLGATAAGTRVGVWHRPGEEDAATKGTKRLKDVFDFYERTYGPYAFGADVGSVSAAWSGGAFGGMEHHPYWHVGSKSLTDEETHAHEAAHGWFGDGVRIACWQDFVLSEGTATYLAARALESLGTPKWDDYACKLDAVCAPWTNTVAYPPTCDRVDMLHHPLWSNVPYMKGAFFLKAVADVLGVDAVDRVLASFYRANVGMAAHMSDLLDALAAADASKADTIRGLATTWLETLECPVTRRACASK